MEPFLIGYFVIGALIATTFGGAAWYHDNKAPKYYRRYDYNNHLGRFVWDWAVVVNLWAVALLIVVYKLLRKKP